jgi:cyclopropane fatty-acyl-phospholipid synthase-like methyltransferase
LSKNINGSFYDADYFERGRVTGKSWLMNYKWMPRRSFKEAFAFIDTLDLDETHYVLDFGCAKGFLVRALRELEIMADGCDISEYALSFAPKGCWNCAVEEEWENRKYTHILTKDVFEHLQPEQLTECLKKLSTISSTIMCVVPLGDNGVYRIKEYHTDLSHVIAEDEKWWRKRFQQSGWKITLDIDHVAGLKDNWYYAPDGNRVFVLEKK